MIRKGLAGLLNRIPQQVDKASSTAWRESKPASNANAGLQIHHQQVKSLLDYQVPTVRRFVPLAPRFTRNYSTHEEKRNEQLENENIDVMEEKFEMINGLKVVMAGAKPNHVLITVYLGYRLKDAIKKGPCKVFTSDLFVKPQEDEKDTYLPDVAVFCETMRFHYDSVKCITSALNPSLVIEVTSKSTEKKDLGLKLLNYLQMPSLKEYIVISSLEVLCWKYTKVEDVWVVAFYTKKSDVINITSLADRKLQISLEDIYEETCFPKLEED